MRLFQTLKYASGTNLGELSKPFVTSQSNVFLEVSFRKQEKKQRLDF